MVNLEASPGSEYHLVVRILRLVPAQAHQTARRMGITAGLKRMVCTTRREVSGPHQ